jgi:chemotaxis protein MotA
VFVFLGILVVLGSVLGGLTMAGGPIPVLLAWSEYVVIVGTAIGTVLMSTPGSVLAALRKKLTALPARNPFDGALYLEALKLLYELFQIGRREGLVAIEGHIERPEESALFKRYPAVLKHHHAVQFLCDALRLVLAGTVPAHDLEMLLDAEIEVHHEGEAKPVSTLQKVADSLPGIGIVAAVLGIVVTMQSINGPIEEIGHHVASALVGTFLGVLLSYGFVSPIATNIELRNVDETRFYHFLKSGVVAFAKGFPPIVAVEFARKAIFASYRPSFQEMETACKSVMAKGN